MPTFDYSCTVEQKETNLGSIVEYRFAAVFAIICGSSVDLD